MCTLYIERPSEEGEGGGRERVQHVWCDGGCVGGVGAGVGARGGAHGRVKGEEVVFGGVCPFGPDGVFTTTLAPETGLHSFHCGQLDAGVPVTVGETLSYWSPAEVTPVTATHIAVESAVCTHPSVTVKLEV